MNAPPLEDVSEPVPYRARRKAILRTGATL